MRSGLRGSGVSGAEWKAHAESEERRVGEREIRGGEEEMGSGREEWRGGEGRGLPKPG